MTREIMVVDDDTDLRTALQDILIGKGREVVSAKDGFQTIEMASEGNIDLIFMDIRMPGMDGVETFLKSNRSYLSASCDDNRRCGGVADRTSIVRRRQNLFKQASLHRRNLGDRRRSGARIRYVVAFAVPRGASSDHIGPPPLPRAVSLD